jgi:hypothetical protein
MKNVKGGAPPRAPNAKIQSKMINKYNKKKHKGKTNLRYKTWYGKTYYGTKTNGKITVAKKGRFKKSSSSKLAKNNREINKLESKMKSLQDSLKLNLEGQQKAAIKKSIQNMNTKIKKI